MPERNCFTTFKEELSHLGIMSEEHFNSLPAKEQDRLLDCCNEIEDNF